MSENNSFQQFDENSAGAENHGGEMPQNGGSVPPAGWQSYSGRQENPQPDFVGQEQGGSQNQGGFSWQGAGQPSYGFGAEYEKVAAEGPAKGKSSTGIKIFAVIVSVLLVVTLAALGGVLIYTYQNYNAGPGNGASESVPQLPVNPEMDITIHNRPSPEDENYADGVLSTEAIYVKVRPSVVGIVTYAAQNPFQASSSGSGIILSADGYIITNAHVVSGAYGIVVVLDNDEEYEAELVGIDYQTDLAVIKIAAENLTAAEFGNSDELVVGERVVAIGNPTGLNLAGSTTQGIISGLNRSITIDSETDAGAISMEVIQVDAAINPGNSGGALINKFGQVVGINSSKLASTNIEGIGFAIPLNSAKPIVDDLVRYGYVRGRVRLGITYYPISEVLGAMYGYTPGLLISEVDETMDVAAKGVKPGDTITQINGEDVRDSAGVKAILEQKKPGDTIELTIYRQSVTGKTSTFKVTVELSEDRGSLNNSQTQDSSSSAPSTDNGQRFPFQIP